jgi:NADPH:quinone reductase
MRAIQFREYGGYERLQLVEVPKPEPEAGQVLVKMIAAAINPLDDVTRRGLVSLSGRQPPWILGTEGAGVIAAGASDLAIGSRVMFKQAYDLPYGGTWQEYVLAPRQAVVPLPADTSEWEAAALRQAYEAAYLSLVYRGCFQPGQVVLAPAVGGAVGNAVVQLARVLGAGRVITTAGSASKAQLARELGYEDIIDLSQEPLRAGVARLTNHRGVDLVIDSLGGEITGEAVASLKPGGRLVLVGSTAGAQACLNISDVLAKDARIVGHRTISTPADLREQAFQTIFTLWGEGRIHPILTRTFPLARAAEAQRYQVEGRPFGKVLLTFE